MLVVGLSPSLASERAASPLSEEVEALRADNFKKTARVSELEEQVNMVAQAVSKRAKVFSSCRESWAASSLS